MAKPVLGRGLGALLGGSPIAKPAVPGLTAAVHPAAAPTPQTTASLQAPRAEGEHVQRVALDRIRPCPFQPRKDFSQEALRDLADSIKEQGIVQPLIVRERGGFFELIAGERRWRAAQMVGLTHVPVLVRQADDRTVLELALIENLQRENLNPIEEAQGYAQLMEEFQLTQEEASKKVGKSRAVVANSLRLLKLAPAVQAFLRDGRISVGHAKVVLGLSDAKIQQTAAERIVRDSLNVRQAEALVVKMQARAAGAGTTAATVAPKAADPHVARLEDKLRERLGTKVQLKYAQGKGSLEIAFFSDAELERVLSILGVNVD